MIPIVQKSGWDSEGEAIPMLPSPVPMLAASKERWYAVQTRSQHEKVVASQLEQHGVRTYLPLLAEVHRWSDRRKVIHVPLFPGYAFIHAVTSPDTVAKVVRIDGIVSIVGPRGQGTPIPDEEIEAVQRLLTHEIPYVNHPFLKVGQRVRIRGGAL